MLTINASEKTSKILNNIECILEQLVKKIKINTSITLITGLHIGGNSENVEIGGIDNPVVKLASKGDVPYIPGSSLKGKIRCLLEQVYHSPKIGSNQEVNNLFGYIIC